MEFKVSLSVVLFFPPSKVMFVVRGVCNGLGLPKAATWTPHLVFISRHRLLLIFTVLYRNYRLLMGVAFHANAAGKATSTHRTESDSTTRKVMTLHRLTAVHALQEFSEPSV